MSPCIVSFWHLVQKIQEICILSKLTYQGNPQMSEVLPWEVKMVTLRNCCILVYITSTEVRYLKLEHALNVSLIASNFFLLHTIVHVFVNFSFLLSAPMGAFFQFLLRASTFGRCFFAIRILHKGYKQYWVQEQDKLVFLIGLVL